MSVQQINFLKTLLHFDVTKMAKQKYPLSSPIIFIHRYVSGSGLSLESWELYYGGRGSVGGECVPHLHITKVNSKFALV